MNEDSKELLINLGLWPGCTNTISRHLIKTKRIERYLDQMSLLEKEMLSESLDQLLDLEELISRMTELLQNDQLIPYQIAELARLARKNMEQEHPFGQTMRNILKIIGEKTIGNINDKTNHIMVISVFFEADQSTIKKCICKNNTIKDLRRILRLAGDDHININGYYPTDDEKIRNLGLLVRLYHSDRRDITIQKKRDVKPAGSFYKEKIAKRIRKGLVEIRSSGNPNQSLHTIPLGGIIQTIDEQYRGLMQRDAPKDYVILAKYLELLAHRLKIVRKFMNSKQMI